MALIQHLNTHFIDLGAIVGYLIAAGLSWWPGNRFVRRRHDVLNDRLVVYSPEKTLGRVEDERKKIREQLSMDFAVLIGRMERLLYILAVMINQYGLIAAVIILKAFFGWLDMPRNDQRTDVVERRLDYYYVYVFGNVLSLIIGIALGLAGRTFAAYVNDLLRAVG